MTSVQTTRGKSNNKIVRDEKKRILKENNYCNICGTKHDTYEVDHIIPVAIVGVNHSKNIQLLCVECHKNKTRIDHKIISILKKLNIISTAARVKRFLSEEQIIELYDTLTIATIQAEQNQRIWWNE